MSLLTKSNKSLFPIGIGTWTIGGQRTPEYDNEEQGINAIRYSLSKGQNHIDTAQLYGGFHTDEIVGKAIADTDRQDLFIADKLWKTSVGKGLVRPTVETMLRKLGTDYIDLLYIHAPWADVPWLEAISQIDILIDEGVVRHFGVSNFSVSQMKTTAALTKYGIAANQMNYNVLYANEVGPTFRAYCKDNDIQLVAYQPIKRKEVLANKIVKNIAQSHGATSAQIALAWILAMDALPIPKAATTGHIDENIEAISITLTTSEMEQLSGLGGE